MEMRWLVIGLSCLAAAGVLGVTLWLGPTTMPEPAADGPTASDPDGRADPPARPDVVPPPMADADDGDDLAPPFDPDRVISREQLTDTQFFDDVGGGYTLIEGERRVLMTWRRLTPRPQGVSDVTEPDTWVFLGPQRVLRISAEEGTLVAPRNEPREGRLVGDVVLTLYDARDRERVDLESLRDVQFRVHLDEAEFDLELGHIESDSPMRLVGPRVVFRGRGLALTYNELRNRIERLEIAEGESLRFRSDLDAPREDRTTSTAYARRPGVQLASASTPTLHLLDNATAANNANDAEATDNADEPDEPGEPVQFYRATFHEAVRIAVGQDRMDMAADELEAVFSFEADPGASASEADRRAAAPRGVIHRTSDATSAPAPDDASAADDEPTPADNALFTPSPDDVVIRWTGPLLMVPAEAPPTDFAGPEDVLLTLTGAPAVARTGDGESIEGRSIDYLTSIGRLRAERSDAEPVTLAGPRFGTLTGERLEIDQSQGAGYLLGPGALDTPINGRAVSDNDHTNADPTDADDDTRANESGDALRLRYGERLNLSFYLDDADGDGTGGPPRIRGLRTATFHGEVTVNHPEFDLSTRQLDAVLADPDAASAGDDGAGVLRRIDALGDVALVARPANEPPLELDADALSIDMMRDARPQRIRGRGSVHTRQPDQRLWAEALELQFLETPTSEAPQAGDDADLRGLERMIATGNVRIELDDPATQLFGHRVTAEVMHDQIELFAGATVEPGPIDADAMLARVVTDDAVLAGEHIVMRQGERAVSVDGPGWFEAQLADEAPGADADSDADELPDDLRVTWARAMHYDDAVGHARFLGDVRADTRDAHSRAWLTTDELQLQLADEGAQVTASEQAEEARGGATRRRIGTATAQGESRFTAEQFSADGQPHTKLRLDGPLISFDGEADRVQVIGPGRMFIDDQRPPSNAGETDADETDETDETDADGANPGAPGSGAGVRFSGRGQTLFLWQKQLTLDAGAREMLMERTVQMIHQPADEPDVVQLDAQRLLTRFAPDPRQAQAETADQRQQVAGATPETSGVGLTGWGGRGGGEPIVELIRAGGSVRVVHGPRTVTSDHLQYTRGDRRVRLWADPETEGLVRVHHVDQPTGLSAAQVIWALERDRFEATDLGPGLVPLPE